MNIADINNLFLARNESEDFNVLVCAADEEAAANVAASYGRDTNMEGAFSITPFEDQRTRVDCDYVLTETDSHDDLATKEKLLVEVRSGDVFINGKFVSQLCWDADSVGYAVANYLKGITDDDE